MFVRYRLFALVIPWILVLFNFEPSQVPAAESEDISGRPRARQFDNGMPRIANHCFEPPTRQPEQKLYPCQDWHLVAGAIDVPTIRGGHHVYKIVAKAGCTNTFSFCQHGGVVNFDTGLSIWNAAADMQLECNMDTCGFRSEVIWTAPADGEYLLRIGGMLDLPVGYYKLAYHGCDSCSTETSVEGVSWSLVKTLLR